ncbi:GatB/YqeY domain-containing protein [Pseudobacteriovorax antillogorgiicola]|nr:GatB/YqeY domain-containing protein [Pseudobacteriovorax antillogorgiicola]
MEQIKGDLKDAMKAKDKFKTQVLRMVLSEFNYANTAPNAEGDDQMALKVLSSYHKRLVKSLDDYPEGDRRNDIQKEVALVALYLPAKVGAREVEAAIDKLFADTEERQFGVLMKSLMKQFGQKADGKLISTALKKRLGE